ncbi:centrosomal protein of 192 kDa isoform X2 [Hemicordylus capensis]|uniref:centrosomal protein of 192 kDa isoform X2 n=1 Tax=Hemicordylus capensis TaxID=884348 RepID=UPI00230213A5|nr:centrosomal protein of 192 kDa isoform X2 [Hemicordylus capensis]
MEDFRNIEDETLPSFLVNSLTSHTSEILENITISSNLGLPVAASTEARQKTGCHDRLCAQASYMETKSCISLSCTKVGEPDSDPRRKLILNVQDAIECGNKDTETLLEQDQKESDLLRRRQKNCIDECTDLTTRIRAFTERESEDFKVASLEPNQKWKSEIGNSDVTGFIENEKLLSFASLEQNSTDEIGDEEFCDDQLEAYFEQLVLPEMQIEDKEEYELGENIKAVELLPDQEKFQIPNVCQAAPRNDSPVASDEELYEFKQAVHNEDKCSNAVLCPVPVSCPRSWQRESYDASSVGIVGHTSEISSRTTDSRQIHSDVEDCLDCGIEDGMLLKTNTVSNSRNKNRDATEDQVSRIAAETSYNKDATEITSSSQLKLNSLYFKCTDGNNTASEQQAQSSHLCQAANESNIPVADEYLYTSADEESEQYLCAAEEPPHSVVYQNEEGRWVTDLAYYTSFNKEQALNLSNISGNFITGSEAIAMIAQDQEEFEREHKFMQEEKIDSQNTCGLGDISWKSVGSHNPLRVSQADDFFKDASYLRLTLGEFFGQRSEALGCLGGGGDVKRPSFGYQITSPEKRRPVPLLMQSDVSSANSGQHSDSLQGNLDSSAQQLHTESTTFTLGKTDTPARVNMEMDTKIKTQEKLEERKVESKYPEIEPSVLSISTIASAIANASVSAEPVQLASMIMRLSKKSREKTDILEGSNLTDPSVISQLISSNLENTAFDIEKYLRRTDEIENNSEPESFAKCEDTAINQQQFLYKQECEIPCIGDISQSNLYIKYGNEKKYLERMQEENYMKISPCDTSSTKKKREMGYIEAVSNIGENFQSKKLTSALPDSKEKPSGSAKVSLENSVTSCNSYSEPEGRISMSNWSLKTTPVLVCPLPVCPNKDKTTCNEKHVTFEKTSFDQKIGEAVGVIEQTIATPVPDIQNSDDQYSFRPSTSPLTHSSPSEASGTALSGSDVDCSCTTFDPKESSCNNPMLPQSCSDPSFGRLTFVSATENTLNLTRSSPERCQRNSANELSTTIVRSSPTSLLGQDSKEKKIALQSNTYPRPAASQKDLNKKLKRNVCGEPTRNPEDQKSTEELPPKSEDQCAQTCRNDKEPGQVDIPVTQHGYTDATHELGLSSTNMLPAYNSLGSYISLNQNIANLKSHGAAPEMPTISSGIPTLLTGCSLRNTPFAQQYLGNLPSHTNVALPQYVGCPPVFGVPAGLFYSAIPVGHIQNSLATGMTLGPEIRSGMLGTTSQCNFTSNQKGFNSTSHTGPAVDTGGSKCEASMPLGFGHVRVPEELKFPNACCVGLTSHTVLSILNPSDRWLQVSISLVSVMLNGKKVELLKQRCLLFKNKTIIGPCTTEELKMLFLPCQAGVYQCVLSVASWPFSSDADTIVQAEALAARVILNAVAENPNLEVEAGTTNQLDFGDLPSGSWKALPLKLTNMTRARVPVRLVIHANAAAWRCFTFLKEPVNPSVKSTPHTYNISQLAAPSVISHVMNASCEGQDPDVLIVWVRFQAPSKHTSSEYLGPPDEYFARVDVEVDCPEPPNSLKSIPLLARSGTPRIYAPKGLQTLYMSARMGLSARQQLPLKNAGNIKVDLKIMILEPDSGISVNPENLALIPGEEQELSVDFAPKDYRNAESVVKIFVLPSGPEYKVTVKGEVFMEESKPSIQNCYSSEVPPILANKQLVVWGGVQLGRTVQQKLILRNDSVSTTQQLRLLIRGQDQDCFQLKLGERGYNNYEIKIRPKHDYSVYLIFSPSRLACMFAKLEMKQLGFQSQIGMKFTIPLYGYGGKSSVILEDVKKHYNRYIVELTEPSPGKTSQTSFSIRNIGCRAAFVKALCSNNCKRTVLDTDPVQVFPEKFVLKENAQQKITVTCNSAEREQNDASVRATICFFYGDEISRQQYRRATQHNPDQEQNILPADNPVINVKFDEEFPGEELVTEVYDLPQQTNDIECFFKNMRRITLSAVNTSTGSALNIKSTSVARVTSERPGVSQKHSMTLDVLPVKGPHGCVLSSNTSGLDENKFVSQETWTIKPEFLTLTVPSLSGTTDTRHAQFTNHSNRLLKFELSWPAHCLTITPHHGTIEPGCCISIHVSPNPSLAEEKSLFPWSGLIYIHCDNGQKLVRVQIHENISIKQPGKCPLVAKIGVHNQPTELPIHVIKPLQKPSSTKIEINSRTLVFPETRSGENSEKCLEIENDGDENVRWYLSSFAPPYVKGVDESGEVYRATYTAFRCSCVSGILEVHGKDRVLVTFLPRDRGHYSQFWDLECHPLHKPHLKDKHRLQFSGVGVIETKAATAALGKVSVQVSSQRRDYVDSSDHRTGKEVYAQDDVYTFPPTRIGDTSMLKITMRNYSTSSNRLTFINPNEPFYIKHSHYNLRCHHYCNLPVMFKPASSGTFKSVLVVQTDKNGTLTIQLVGEGLA